MAEQILQLFPLPSQELPLHGLYLSHDLRGLAAQAERPLVYTNYIASLDGRIAVPRADGSGMTVPKQIANDRDWRLFQELAVQADVIITSGRYLRDYGEGRAQEILQVYDDPRFTDLHEWRQQHGLSVYPDLAVISGSLEFPIPEALVQQGRSVLIFTTAQADPVRITELEAQLGRVLVAGDVSVRGDLLVAHLQELGYGLIYNSTGPKVMHLLLAGGVLDRLYLTLANRLLGGNPFSSIVEGSLLEPATGMTLESLYFDLEGLDGLGQLFAAYHSASRVVA